MIDRALEAELRLHLREDIELAFMRIAINKAQIKEYDLPTKPAKASARRITKTVEAEAMPAHVMRNLLRSFLASMLPEHALREAKAAEEAARAELDRLARRARR